MTPEQIAELRDTFDKLQRGIHVGREKFNRFEQLLPAVFDAAERCEKLESALKACDDAFASWQCGQIPGRPEDILKLITQVRAAIATETKQEKSNGTE